MASKALFICTTLIWQTEEAPLSSYLVSSVLTVRSARIVNVSVVHANIEVFFCIASLEKVWVFTPSERIVPVLALVAATGVQRLLDVPEYMSWNGPKNLSLQGCAKTVAISRLEILNEVIFLTLLENTKLLVENFAELFDLEWALIRVKLLNQNVVPGFFVL